MAESLSDQSLQEAEKVSGRVRELLSTAYDASADLATEGELAALAGVRKFPARVKCALLPWETLPRLTWPQK